MPLTKETVITQLEKFLSENYKTTKSSTNDSLKKIVMDFQNKLIEMPDNSSWIIECFEEIDRVQNKLLTIANELNNKFNSLLDSLTSTLKAENLLATQIKKINGFYKNWAPKDQAPAIIKIKHIGECDENYFTDQKATQNISQKFFNEAQIALTNANKAVSNAVIITEQLLKDLKDLLKQPLDIQLKNSIIFIEEILSKGTNPSTNKLKELNDLLKDIADKLTGTKQSLDDEKKPIRVIVEKHNNQSTPIKNDQTTPTITLTKI